MSNLDNMQCFSFWATKRLKEYGPSLLLGGEADERHVCNVGVLVNTVLSDIDPLLLEGSQAYEVIESALLAISTNN